MPERPPATAGLHHVALYAQRFDESLRFYTELIGMTIEWHPDPDNVYLTSGSDNLAIHRGGPDPDAAQRLDHIGFILDRIEDVDAWHAYLDAAGVKIAQPPKTHRDGARSFYCYDPDGTLVQLIFHPPLAKGA